MPSRVIREGILTSERVDLLNDTEEVFYRRLQSVADDFGRFSAHPAQLRAACYPLRLDRVTEAEVYDRLKACIEAGLIETYQVKGAFYLEVLRFDQRTRIMRSKWPLRHDERLEVVEGDKGGKCYVIKRLSNDGHSDRQMTARPSGVSDNQKSALAKNDGQYDGVIPIPIHTDTEGRERQNGNDGHSDRQIETVPKFEPVKPGLWPREYDAMIAHARTQIEAVKRKPDNWIKDLRDDVCELVTWIRNEGKPDAKSRIEEILKREDSYERTEMKTIPRTIVCAWKDRIKEIERTKAGIKN